MKKIAMIAFGAVLAAVLAGCGGATEQPAPWVSAVTPKLDVTKPNGVDDQFRLAVQATLTNQSDGRLTCSPADFTLVTDNGSTSAQPDAAASSCDQVALAPHTQTTVHLFFANYNANKADYKLFWEDGAGEGIVNFTTPRESVPFVFDSGAYGHGARGY